MASTRFFFGAIYTSGLTRRDSIRNFVILLCVTVNERVKYQIVF